DTFDWKVGPSSPKVIDANYQNYINATKNGTFNREGGILVHHESSNFSMSEAMKFYPALKAAFKVLIILAHLLSFDIMPYGILSLLVLQ
ncbi:hypothetical protein L218DRAFT_850561, partial [Marasmius fiardii PR-910]